MSEGAPELTGGTPAGSQQGGSGSGTQPDAGDEEAQRLLAGMAGQGDDSDPEKLRQQLDHWKQMSRKNERDLRDARAKATQWDQLQESQKTEVQKAQDAAAQAQRERDEAIARHNRVIAAATFNLPVDLIEYLGDGTDEEISGRAEAISKAIDDRVQQLVEQELAGRNGQQLPVMGTRPVASLRPGSAPAQGAMPQTPDQWFRQMLENR